MVGGADHNSTLKKVFFDAQIYLSPPWPESSKYPCAPSSPCIWMCRPAQIGANCYVAIPCSLPARWSTHAILIPTIKAQDLFSRILLLRLLDLGIQWCCRCGWFDMPSMQNCTWDCSRTGPTCDWCHNYFTESWAQFSNIPTPTASRNWCLECTTLY